MVNIRSATLRDIKDIQKVEREYYDGFSCPEDILSNWIMSLPENFFVAEEAGAIVGFLFFEYTDEAKALPFVHKSEHKKKGRFAYVSEVGVLNSLQGSGVMQNLFEKMEQKLKSAGCEAILWLTGDKSKHDRFEKSVLLSNGFAKKENVKNWEAFPGFFVDDHWLWVKEI